MNEIESALQTLCEEVGLPHPTADSRGRYRLDVDGLVLRVGPWSRHDVVLEGIIGDLGENATSHWETQQDLLRQVLTWNIARLKGQARPETLSFDTEENLLLLWRTWPRDEKLTTNLLRGAEEMLNELEFWKSKLLAAAGSSGSIKGLS